MMILTGLCPQCGREVSCAALYCPGCGFKFATQHPIQKPSPDSCSGKPLSSISNDELINDKSISPDASIPLPSPAPPIIPEMVELRSDSRFIQIDQWIVDRLKIDFIAQPFNEPTILSETAQEFYGMLLAGEALSEAQWNILLEQQLREAKKNAERGGGIWGAYLAIQGCFINGWLFKTIFNLENARDAITDTRTIPLLFGTVAHEKWGHGFFSSATSIGNETRELHFDRLRYARLFSNYQVNTPDGVILREKWKAVYNATRFVEEGWATWIESLVRQDLASGLIEVKKPQGQWAINLSVQELSSGYSISAQQALMNLLDTNHPDPEKAKEAMAVLEKSEDELTPIFIARYDRLPRYIIGCALCRMIAQRFGELNVPLAIVLAGNVTYRTSTQSVSDILNFITKSPDLNVNRRLAAIAHLPINDNRFISKQEFAQECHNRLGISIPKKLNL